MMDTYWLEGLRESVGGQQEDDKHSDESNNKENEIEEPKSPNA